MNPFPHHYEVHLRQEGPDSVLTSPMKPAIVGGPPPEFDGRPDRWSPEHLLISALALCFTATFRALAARTDLSLRSYAADAGGRLDKTPDGPRFVSFDLRLWLEVAPGQADLARGLLERAKKHCFVANSLNAPAALVTTIMETSAFVPSAV